ncbi:MAG: hypothetical protein LBG46_03130 [Elusimicrobiota bacterium]|jgi:hypothetical protein|nr:hypothetical protein [Elusimicrobiota bacterium]
MSEKDDQITPQEREKLEGEIKTAEERATEETPTNGIDPATSAGTQEQGSAEAAAEAKADAEQPAEAEAKESEPLPEPDFTKIEKRRVMHRYDNRDMDRINAKIVACLDKMEEVEAERSAVSARIKDIKDEINGLRKSREEQGEWRNLECEVRFHWSRGKKQIIHPETGIVIEELDITPEDRQAPLPGMEEASGQTPAPENETAKAEETVPENLDGTGSMQDEANDPDLTEPTEKIDSQDNGVDNGGGDLDEGDAQDDIPAAEETAVKEN